MKTITITCNDRPQYLEQVLISLEKNNVFGYDVMYCALEPNNKENLRLCESINFIETKIFINKIKQGVRQNPYNVLNEAFEDGSEYNIYLEDDILLSPDAIELADFYYEYFRNNQYLLCSFYNDQNYKLSDISSVFEWNNFVAIGFSLFRSAWYQWFKLYWFNDSISREQNIGGIGWDWSIRSLMKKHSLKSLTPCLPRSTHIGIMGTYCTPREHNKLFGDKLYCKKKIGEFYKGSL